MCHLNSIFFSELAGFPSSFDLLSQQNHIPTVRTNDFVFPRQVAAVFLHKDLNNEQELLQPGPCVPGRWKLSSSSCSSVNIELFTINIL